MQAKRSRMALKTALLAPSGSIVAWGVQRSISGDPIAGGVAVVMGIMFVGAYVAFQEYDIPYEEEIVALIEQNKDSLSEEAVQDISQEVSDAAEKRGIDLSDGDAAEGEES